jgi:hypothetical protein
VRDGALHRIGAFEVANVAASDWEATPPRLTVADALLLVDTPFRVMMENGRGDRAFLLSMATPAQRQFLEYLERTDQLIFQGEGGLGELRAVVREHVTPKAHRRLTHWVLFDSDAPAPTCPSRDATLTAELCTAVGVPFHMLERRAIENYLPKWALYLWAQSSHYEAAARRQTLDAFFRLSPHQRHHFHMKAGFSTNPKAPEGALFATVPDADRAILSGGVGRKVADLFATSDKEKLRYHIEKDGCASELAGSLAKLIELLRVPYG